MSFNRTQVTIIPLTSITLGESDSLMLLVCHRWESRVDPNGRVYYVDHNTRTTTWQRPSPNLINDLQQFQQWRNQRQMNQMPDRFLFPQPTTASDDPLGPMPLGWGKLAVGFFILFEPAILQFRHQVKACAMQFYTNETLSNYRYATVASREYKLYRRRVFIDKVQWRTTTTSRC